MYSCLISMYTYIIVGSLVILKFLENNKLSCKNRTIYLQIPHVCCHGEKFCSINIISHYYNFLLDATLTLSNVSSALEAVKDWRYLGAWLGVPQSTLNQLSRQSSVSVGGKQMMLREWITSHPAPSWDIVTEALYQGGYSYPRWYSILMEVKKLYGKGEPSHTGNPLVS